MADAPAATRARSRSRSRRRRRVRIQQQNQQQQRRSTSRPRQGNRRVRRRMRRRVDNVDRKTNGPKVSVQQSINATLGTISGNQGGDPELEWTSFLNPALIKEAGANTAFTPLTALAGQYARWRLAFLAVDATPLVGASAVSGTAVRLSISLSSAVTPTSWSALGARRHCDLIIGRRTTWRIPAREILGPQQSWWITDTNADPSQCLGPMLSVHSLGRTVNAYTNTDFKGDLFLLTLRATWEFANYTPQPALAGLAKIKPADTSFTVQAVEGQPVELHLSSGTSQLLDAYNGIPRLGLRAAGGSTSETIWMILDTGVKAAATAAGPWGWLIRAGWWFVKKVFGRTSRAGGDVYYVYASASDAQNDKPMIAAATADNQNMQASGLQITQINSPNLGTYGAVANTRTLIIPNAEFNPDAQFVVCGNLRPLLSPAAATGQPAAGTWSNQNLFSISDCMGIYYKADGTIGAGAAINSFWELQAPVGMPHPVVMQGASVFDLGVLSFTPGWEVTRKRNLAPQSFPWMQLSVAGYNGWASTTPAFGAGIFLAHLDALDPSASSDTSNYSTITYENREDKQQLWANISPAIISGEYPRCIVNPKPNWIILLTMGKVEGANHRRTIRWENRQEMTFSPGPSAISMANSLVAGRVDNALLEGLDITRAGYMSWCAPFQPTPGAPHVTYVTSRGQLVDYDYTTDEETDYENQQEPETEETDLDDVADVNAFDAGTASARLVIKEPEECSECGDDVYGGCCDSHACANYLPHQVSDCASPEECESKHSTLEDESCPDLKLKYKVLTRLLDVAFANNWSKWKDFHLKFDGIRPHHGLCAAYVLTAAEIPPPGWDAAQVVIRACDGRGLSFATVVDMACEAADA